MSAKHDTKTDFQVLSQYHSSHGRTEDKVSGSEGIDNGEDDWMTQVLYRVALDDFSVYLF
jgi:hypothetical protein